MHHFYPWHPSRQSVHSHIMDGNNLVSIPGNFAYRSLTDVANQRDLLATYVEPVWCSYKGLEGTVIAEKMISLMSELAESPSLEASIQLYQLFLAYFILPWSVWSNLSDSIRNSPLTESTFLQAYFLSWLQHSPDEVAVDAALFLLKYLHVSPPLTLLLELGRYRRLVSGVASLIETHHNADEDALIGLAASHTQSARLNALQFLQAVVKPENQQWLLTDGYDSGIEYEPCAYYAAVKGGLLARLQAAEVPPTMLVHYARSLAIMANAFGGNVRTLFHYPDGPEAVERLFHHIAQVGQSTAFRSELWGILRLLFGRLKDAKDETDYPPWTVAVCQRLYTLGRLHFEPPLANEDATEELYWEKPKPTLNDVIAGNLTVLSEVLEEAWLYSGDETVSKIVEWATAYLCLEADPQVRAQRAEELLQLPMPGVLSGGWDGVTHPGWASVYGQILLQTVQAMPEGKPIGWPLLRTCLESNLPHLRLAAANVFVRWPTSALPKGAFLHFFAAWCLADTTSSSS
jgi:hypothetical protein